MEIDVCPSPGCGKPLRDGNNPPTSWHRFRVCEDGHLLITLVVTEEPDADKVG